MNDRYGMPGGYDRVRESRAPHDRPWDTQLWGAEQRNAYPGLSHGEDLGDRVRHAFEHAIDRGEELLSRAGESIKGFFQGSGPKGWSRADARILEDVCERLTESPDVDASSLEVNVEQGEVTLTGSAPDRRTKVLAERVAEQVYGVKDVHNRIQVQRTLATPSGSTATTAASVGTTGAEPSFPSPRTL